MNEVHSFRVLYKNGPDYAQTHRIQIFFLNPHVNLHINLSVFYSLHGNYAYDHDDRCPQQPMVLLYVIVDHIFLCVKGLHVYHIF